MGYCDNQKKLSRDGFTNCDALDTRTGGDHIPVPNGRQRSKREEHYIRQVIRLAPCKNRLWGPKRERVIEICEKHSDKEIRTDHRKQRLLIGFLSAKLRRKYDNWGYQIGKGHCDSQHNIKGLTHQTADQHSDTQDHAATKNPPGDPLNRSS
nr:hypothetical protein [Enteractinococcus helveticum]